VEEGDVSRPERRGEEIKSPAGRVLFISDKFSVDGFLPRLE